jgi:hypothetical protein
LLSRSASLTRSVPLWVRRLPVRTYKNHEKQLKNKVPSNFGLLDPKSVRIASGRAPELIFGSPGLTFRGLLALLGSLSESPSSLWALPRPLLELPGSLLALPGSLFEPLGSLLALLRLLLELSGLLLALLGSPLELRRSLLATFGAPALTFGAPPVPLWVLPRPLQALSRSLTNLLGSFTDELYRRATSPLGSTLYSIRSTFLLTEFRVEFTARNW